MDQGGSQPGEGRSTLIRRGSRRSSRKTRDEAPRPVGVRGGSLATRCRQRVDRSAWIKVDQSGSGRFPAGGGRIHPDPAWITRRSSRRTRDKGPRPVGVRGGSSARHVATEWTGARGSEWIRVDQGGSSLGEGGSTLIRRGSRRSSRGPRAQGPRPVGVRRCVGAPRRDMSQPSGPERVDQSGSEWIRAVPSWGRRADPP